MNKEEKDMKNLKLTKNLINSLSHIVTQQKSTKVKSVTYNRKYTTFPVTGTYMYIVSEH